MHDTTNRVTRVTAQNELLHNLHMTQLVLVRVTCRHHFKSEIDNSYKKLLQNLRS